METYTRASLHLVNSFDLIKIQEKPPISPGEVDRVGWVDKFGLYFIEMPEHHVYLDERNFFSRYLQGERQRTEKESIVEAFSKSRLS